LEERVGKPVWFSVEEGRSKATLENRGFPRAIGAKRTPCIRNLRNNKNKDSSKRSFYLDRFMLYL